MTFAAYESTAHLGNPVELYEFTAESEVYRYVHYDEDVIIDGYTWEAVYLSRSRFSRGEGADKAKITLTTSLEFPFLSVFESGIPESRISLKIYRVHLTDPDLERRLIWDGQVMSRSFSAKQVSFKCEPPDSSLGTMGLRRRFQLICPYPLYSPGCKVDKNAYQNDVTLSWVSEDGLHLGTPIGDCSIFAGGFLTRTIGSVTKVAFITWGGTDNVFIQRATNWLVQDAVIKMYPGCDKTTSTCSTRFNNLNNFGGFPGMPVDNIFSTQAF